MSEAERCDDAALVARSTTGGPSAWQVVSRLTAAIGGGYAAAWGYTAFASRALIRAGFSHSDAVATATMTAYVVMLVIALAAFAVRRLWLFALATAGATLLLGVAAHLLGAS